ncbi:hypothetical protein STREPTOSP366_40990, partial [Streptomyces variabilis]
PAPRPRSPPPRAPRPPRAPPPGRPGRRPTQTRPRAAVVRAGP